MLKLCCCGFWIFDLFFGFIYLDCLDGDDVLFWGMCDLCLVTLLSPHTSFLLFSFSGTSEHTQHTCVVVVWLC